MRIEPTSFKGLYVVDNFHATDDRGVFCKTVNKLAFQESHINFEIRESFYSVSHANVLRGMHFQLPPCDHDKLVYVPSGHILDVVVDLRKLSNTYKQSFSIELSSKNKKSLFIPRGFAHGFKSLKDDTITVYCVSSEYNASFDAGIHYDSLDYDWKSNELIMSDRDSNFQTVKEFYKVNPF
jgi:dTDP-4-dehydrorhamnose 3,5-epimerase/CDP-3, 6-dideoxy-D-glycero-D-glycero-4-hexulose-5-epimerase